MSEQQIFTETLFSNPFDSTIEFLTQIPDGLLKERLAKEPIATALWQDKIQETNDAILLASQRLFMPKLAIKKALSILSDSNFKFTQSDIARIHQDYVKANKSLKQRKKQVALRGKLRNRSLAKAIEEQKIKLNALDVFKLNRFKQTRQIFSYPSMIAQLTGPQMYRVTEEHMRMRSQKKGIGIYPMQKLVHPSKWGVIKKARKLTARKKPLSFYQKVGLSLDALGKDIGQLTQEIEQNPGALSWRQLVTDAKLKLFDLEAAFPKDALTKTRVLQPLKDYITELEECGKSRAQKQRASIASPNDWVKVNNNVLEYVRKSCDDAGNNYKTSEKSIAEITRPEALPLPPPLPPRSNRKPRG